MYAGVLHCWFMAVLKSDLLCGILVYVMIASSGMRGYLWFPERM